MPFTAPSIYQPGTVDLLSLILQSKNKSSVLKNALGNSDPFGQEQSAGPGVAPSSASEAAGNGTAQSVAVGNAVGSGIGNLVMSAVIGPVGMAALSLAGAPTPQGFVSQAIAQGKVIAHALQAPDPNAIPDDDQNPLNDIPDPGDENPDSIDATQGSQNSGSDQGADSATGGNEGGSVSSNASGDYFHGGVVPGKSKSKDDTQINVTSGEAVLHRGVVEAMGKPFIDFLNNSIPNVLGGK